ncbi:uncharacterized protein TNIN_292571 [Trichonephila inaurata madagascariensis]|uniref:DNA-directed DNA polymerase n=1 Tax=Trichonephila inaurata madagascariensis TaxID=2747483 RepID=A0A8X6XLF3_9ARAC|nr:uncharacterized protein TNIN_292571 [Trichonephila inaurata madagascariensis]
MALILKDSPECVKSELELFNFPGTQTDIQDGQWKQFHPLSNVFDNAPVEFHISGSAEDYIDLSQTQLYVKAKIVKVDNKPITKDDTIRPVHGYDSKTSQLTAELFYKDSDDGLKKRTEFFKESATVDMIGCIHSDLFHQDRLLLNLVDLKIKLIRSKPEFCLQGTEGFKVVLDHVSLFIRKVRVNPGVILGCVDKEAFYEAFSKSPYKFKHFNINFIGVYVDGPPVPHNPLELDFSKDQYIRAYQTLFVGIDRIGQDREKIDLLLRKGVFPYDYFNSFEKCNDSSLPPTSKFYNKLNEKAISVEDYNHACKVFNEFHLNNLGEYCDLYVKTDVLLLTDLFENFRKICMQTYKLDPCWYFTTSALSWDAMLLHTKVANELFTDYDMLLFIEKGVRGGISQCYNRYATATNKYMSNFNPDDEIKYLMYLDANNLYGYAMSKYLPLKDFVWSDNNLTEQDILNLSDESDVGYILEVDLEYPSDLHDKHSDFPLAPENKVPPNCKKPRLLTTLEPKTKCSPLF